jgi:hypothetical protein
MGQTIPAGYDLTRIPQVSIGMTIRCNLYLSCPKTMSGGGEVFCVLTPFLFKPIANAIYILNKMYSNSERRKWFSLPKEKGY